MTHGPIRGPGELTIATTIDDRWVPHFATCVASIGASRGPESIRFVMLQGPTLSDASIKDLGDFVRSQGMEFDAIPISAEVEASLPPTSQVFSPLVWYRLLLPDVLPELDRVLFLDADTIVLQSLAPLFDLVLGDNLLAAVSSGQPEDHMRALGLDPTGPYFNAGVMLMNLEAMRTDGFSERALAFGHHRPASFIFNDQDVLNVLTADRCIWVHPRWNAMSHLWLFPNHEDRAYSPLARAAARMSPAIVHFEGFQTVKPWFYRSVHPLRFLYRDYRAQTPWPLEELERRSLGGAVLRRLPIGLQYAITRAKSRAVERLKRPAIERS